MGGELKFHQNGDTFNLKNMLLLKLMGISPLSLMEL